MTSERFGLRATKHLLGNASLATDGEEFERALSEVEKIHDLRLPRIVARMQNGRRRVCRPHKSLPRAIVCENRWSNALPMRDWIARLAANHFNGIFAISRIPVVGPLVRKLGKFVVPAQTLVWMQIQSGPGEGLWIELNPRTAQAVLEGEPPVEKFLQEKLKPGMVFYDVGANYGFFSLIAARLVGDRGAIYAFEPVHKHADRMRANLRRNGFSRFTVTEAAVWREGGSVSFAVDDEAFAPDQRTSMIISDGAADYVTTVPAISLDDFVRGAPPPDLIKCDVEGAEVEVFRGAAQMLAAHHPTIVCEVHSSYISSELRKLLASLGYTVRDLDRNHIGAEFPQQ
jgi:FkbM family methyltransferase